MPIYVLHSVVLMLFYAYGINVKIQSLLGIKWYDEMLYLLLFGGGVLGVTFILAECVFLMKYVFVKMKSGRKIKQS